MLPEHIQPLINSQRSGSTFARARGRYRSRAAAIPPPAVIQAWYLCYDELHRAPPTRLPPGSYIYFAIRTAMLAQPSSGRHRWKSVKTTYLRFIRKAVDSEQSAGAQKECGRQQAGSWDGSIAQGGQMVTRAQHCCLPDYAGCHRCYYPPSRHQSAVAIVPMVTVGTRV